MIRAIPASGFAFTAMTSGPGEASVLERASSAVAPVRSPGAVLTFERAAWGKQTKKKYITAINIYIYTTHIYPSLPLKVPLLHCSSRLCGEVLHNDDLAAEFKFKKH